MLFAHKLLAPGPRPKHPANVKLWEPPAERGVHLKEIMKQEEIKNSIYRYIDAYNNFDIDAMIGMLAPDVRFENVSGGEVNAKTSGKAEFEVLAGQSARLFASRKQTVKTIKIEGDSAFVEIEFEGVLAEDLPNGVKAGEKLALQGTSEFVFMNGFISSIVDKS
jgi:ketosteroid isomerase-like protein